MGIDRGGAASPLDFARDRRARPALIAVALVALVVAGLAAQDALPDAETFFTQTRENLSRAGRVQDRYAYKERRSELHMNPFGKIGTGGIRVDAVSPIAGRPGMFERMRLERDGKPVTDSKPERFERKRRREGRSSIDDAASAMSFSMDRRERIDGRDVIVIRFKPKPGAKPQTREGKLATVLEGTIWVDEAAREVMRAEATAIDDVSYGFGLIAKLRKGATMSLTRAPAAGQVWLPTSIRFSGEGTAMMFRKLTVNHVIEWFDYSSPPAS
jgi:hypothetical protein